MRVIFNDSFSMPRQSFAAGKAYEVEDVLAAKLIKKGTASEVKPIHTTPDDQRAREQADALRSNQHQDRRPSDKI